jgi:hypothetical protein
MIKESKTKEGKLEGAAKRGRGREKQNVERER